MLSSGILLTSSGILALREFLSGLAGRSRVQAGSDRSAALRVAACRIHSMILTGTFTFEGPRTRVWEILQDPEVLAKALPGTKTLTRVG